MLTNITSDYFPIDKLNRVIENTRSKALTIFHCNIRSLLKTITLLNDVIYTLSSKPDVIVVTETMLNGNTVINIDMHGYNSYHVDSLTAACGAGIYVNCSLKTINRPDIKFSMEFVVSCWIEIKPGYTCKNTITGCNYRHPKGNIDQFMEQLEKLLQHLNQCKYQVILLGDFNADFLQYITYQLTEKYLDMLYANNFFPLITKPIRATDHSKTLIDHIYTNMPTDQFFSGIAISDFSGHLPIFCVTAPYKKVTDKQYYRDYSTI